MTLGGANGRGALEPSWSGGLTNGSGFDLFVFEHGTVPTGSELYYASLFSGDTKSEQRSVKPSAMMLATGGQTPGFLMYLDFSMCGFGAGISVDMVRLTGGRAGDLGTFDPSTGTWIVPADFTSGASTLTDAQGNAFSADRHDADMLLVGVLRAPSTAVPEPSTYALMASGLAARGAVARRRRTNA